MDTHCCQHLATCMQYITRITIVPRFDFIRSLFQVWFQNRRAKWKKRKKTTSVLRPPAPILPSHLAQSYNPNPIDPLCTYHNDHRWSAIAPSGVPTMATTSLPSSNFNQSSHDLLQQPYQPRSTLSGLNQQLAQTPQLGYQTGGFPIRDMPISSSPTLQDLQCSMPNGGSTGVAPVSRTYEGKHLNTVQDLATDKPFQINSNSSLSSVLRL